MFKKNLFTSRSLWELFFCFGSKIKSFSVTSVVCLLLNKIQFLQFFQQGFHHFFFSAGDYHPLFLLLGREDFFYPGGRCGETKHVMGHVKVFCLPCG